MKTRSLPFRFTRKASLLLTAVMFLSPACTFADTEQLPASNASPQTVSVMERELEHIYYTDTGTLMLPLRETAETLGLTVKWIGTDKTVEVADDVTSAKLHTNQNRYETAAKLPVELAAGAENRSGTVYVPCSFFEEFFFVEQKTDERGMITLTCKDVKEPSVLNEFASLTDGNWQGLTKEEKLEDFDKLYQTLKENYPYFHVLKRMHNVDLDTEYEKFRKDIEASETDAQFYTLLDSFTRKARMVGHLSVIAPFEYDWYAATYRNTDGLPPEAIEAGKKLSDAYSNEKTQKAYRNLQNKFWPVFQKVQDLYALQSAGDSGELPNPSGNDGQASETSQASSNVKTQILEEGKTAYLFVQSFDMQFYEQDKKILSDFYEKVRDYDNVIFDFTQNGGGGMSYFNDLIVAPNIDHVLTAKVYQLAKNGEYNRSFMDFDDWNSISKLPQLPRMNEDDRRDLDLMLGDAYTVEPSGTEKILKGKLWILVNENVFSSSEYAAMFAKSTGFATLVGTQTGGDGIGSDPLPIVLPHSSLLVRYSPIYGVTPDGASSQEFGTTPDIISPNNEAPLDTCLRQIR